ncbi:MAG: universal stress protein [Euryarchaeota archaeon]|nr:universal stress protein [Euryarchaeota archaeon]
MKSILLPTDGTVPSEEAALYAMDMAKRLKAKVKALYAVDDSLYTTYHWAKIREQVIEELEKDGKDALDKVKKLGKEEGVEVEGVMEHGLIHEVIAKHAGDDKDVAMVVMAGSGKDWASRVFLGSVTAKIVRGTRKWVPCPVWVTPCTKLNPDARLGLQGSILLPTDGSPPSEDAARYAARVAKLLGARLIALYVVDTGAVGFLTTNKDEVIKAMEEEGKMALDRVAEIGIQEGAVVETVLEKGLVHEVIANYARFNKEVSMVIMAGSGKDWASRILLGSVTEKIIRGISKWVPCTIVITPSQKINPEARLTL